MITGNYKKTLMNLKNLVFTDFENWMVWVPNVARAASIAEAKEIATKHAVKPNELDEVLSLLDKKGHLIWPAKVAKG